MAKVGGPPDRLWAHAVLEIAAAVGVILYFLGALAFHVRACDKDFPPAAAFLIVAVAAPVLRVNSA